MKKKIKKVKNKIHPYTQESLRKKDKLLKMLLSITEVSLLLPIADALLEIVGIKTNKILWLASLYLLFLLFFYLIKDKGKRYNFSKWEFLDDEINIFTDRKLDGEIKDFLLCKCYVIIAINILLIIPLSLTFSAILASALSFIFTFFLEDIFINLIKFLLIAIIFKNFFKPSNDILINYLDDKKELY